MARSLSQLLGEEWWGLSEGRAVGGEWTDWDHIKEVESEGSGSRIPPVINIFMPLWIFTALVRGESNFLFRILKQPAFQSNFFFPHRLYFFILNLICFWLCCVFVAFL